VIKSHLNPAFLPPNLHEKCKVVYVARNPRDSAISFFHHMKIMPHGYIDSLENFLEQFMKGILLYGDYWSHVQSGWELKDHPNVKFIWYEDMKADTRKVVKELTEFLNHPLTDEKIDDLTQHISFDAMKMNRAANPSFKMKLPPGKDFFRKGQVGDWKNHFTEEQVLKFDKWVEEGVNRTGVKLPV